MANGNSTILTAEEEKKLRKPIDEYVGKIQAKIDDLRKDGTDRVLSLQNHMDSIKRDRSLTRQEKEAAIASDQAEIAKAKSVEAGNKDKVAKLIAEAEAYLKSNFDKDYYEVVKQSCYREKAEAKENYSKRVAQLEQEHKAAVAKLSDHQEIKDENYVHKNRLFDAKMQLEKDLQEVKDRRHAAYTHKYHLIDLLRMSKFTFAETSAQKWENYKYTFNRRAFLA